MLPALAKTAHVLGMPAMQFPVGTPAQQ